MKSRPLFLTLILFWMFASHSLAAVTQAHYTLEQLTWDKAKSLNGHSPEASLYLPISKDLGIQKMVLNLKLLFSKELDANTRLEIKFNQTLLKTLSLPAGSTQEQNVQLELPLALLSGPWQTLSFSAFFESKKNLCHPDIWIYISPQSTLVLDTEALPFKGTLKGLPSPFISPSDLLYPVSTQLLLPEAPSLKEIFALFHTAFRLGEAGAHEDMHLEAHVLGATTPELKNNNLILIGFLSHILENSSEAFKNFLQKNPLKTSAIGNEGLLWLNQSPFDPTRALLVLSGKTEAGLNKAAQAFLMDEFDTLASGHQALVYRLAARPLPDFTHDFRNLTLKSLHYDNKNVSGLGRHQISFNVALPNDKTPGPTSIQTFITTPVFNQQGSSQVTLAINDQKQATYWFKSLHNAWNVKLDPSAMKPGLNKLDFFLDLHFDENRAELCTRENFDEVWATLYAKTKLDVSFSPEFPFAFLNQLPVPFAEKLTVLLPEPLSAEDINQFSQFFLRMGQWFALSPIHVDFRKASDVDEEFVRSQNVLILGLPETNPWVAYALKDMPLQLQGGKRSLQSGGNSWQVSGPASTGLLELMPSLWSEKQAVLLITGDNRAGLYLGLHALINDSLRAKLDGNIALVNPDGTFGIFNSRENRYLSPGHQARIYLTNVSTNLFYYLKNNPQIFIYILVFLLPLWIVLRRKRRK